MEKVLSREKSCQFEGKIWRYHLYLNVEQPVKLGRWTGSQKLACIPCHFSLLRLCRVVESIV